MFLPKPIQNCFSFCSIFPQDYKFDKDDLVRMWIAVGFIQLPSNSGEIMEDIGGRYFDILIKKSFFDKFKSSKFYKMHDLLHQLAQSIFAQECFRLVNDEELFSRIPKTIRHLFVETSNLKVLKKIAKFKNLRSLYLTYKNNDQDFGNGLTKVFEASRSLRLLHIDGMCLKLVPETIGCLLHLRYLKIIGVNITLLPRSLSNLYLLQFIIFDDIRYLHDNFLPKDINNLLNLRCLKFPFDSFSGIQGIGRLTSLQKLFGFRVKENHGYRIGELEHMNNLRHLTIKLLENVNDAVEACNAKLCDKRNLMNLSLDWGDFEDIPYNIIYNRGTRTNPVNPNLDERVFDNLQPHNNLKTLRITEYMGCRSAIWMNKAHLISNLEQITLNKCLEWQSLPPFGRLPFLKFLYLLDMPKVEQLKNKFHENDKDFPSLKVLHINKLEVLEDWFDTTAADECLFPCLTDLCLMNCPNLKELPHLPPKLKRLEMDNIGWKTLNCCSISKSIPLVTLKVRGCPNIAYIHLANGIARLAELRYLAIVDCPNLISLGGHQEVETAENYQLILSNLRISDPSLLLMEPLRSITSLERLTIEKNDELVSFPFEAEEWFLQVRSFLRELFFIGLKSLQSISSSLESFSSLKILCVYDVPQLQLLPNIPDSLEQLNLRDLESLQCLPSSLSTISSLQYLSLERIPLLKLLPDLPPSLCTLKLDNLENLDCLPFCLPSLSSLTGLYISKVPQLRELPDLPPSLKSLLISQCHPELKERFENF